MSKKEFFVIFGSSIIAMYIATLVDTLLNGSIVAGKSGFPFKFDSSSLFGGSNIDYLMLFLNVLFWFIVVLTIWKVIVRPSGRGKRGLKK